MVFKLNEKQVSRAIVTLTIGYYEQASPKSFSVANVTVRYPFS